MGIFRALAGDRPFKTVEFKAVPLWHWIAWLAGLSSPILGNSIWQHVSNCNEPSLVAQEPWKPEIRRYLGKDVFLKIWTVDSKKLDEHDAPSWADDSGKETPTGRRLCLDYVHNATEYTKRTSWRLAGLIPLSCLNIDWYDCHAPSGHWETARLPA